MNDTTLWPNTVRRIGLQPTNVKVTSFVSATLVSPTAAIVALPFQIPANAAGIVAPVVAGGDDAARAAVRDAVAAGLLALPSSAPPPEAAGEAGGDPRVSSTTASAMTAAAATAQAARTGPRRDRAGAPPGTG